MKRGDLVSVSLSPERSAQARRALAGGWGRVVEHSGAVVVVAALGGSAETFHLSQAEVQAVD